MTPSPASAPRILTAEEVTRLQKKAEAAMDWKRPTYRSDTVVSVRPEILLAMTQRLAALQTLGPQIAAEIAYWVSNGRQPTRSGSRTLALLRAVRALIDPPPSEAK